MNAEEKKTMKAKAFIQSVQSVSYASGKSFIFVYAFSHQLLNLRKNSKQHFKCQTDDVFIARSCGFFLLLLLIFVGVANGLCLH